KLKRFAGKIGIKAESQDILCAKEILSLYGQNPLIIDTVPYGVSAVDDLFKALKDLVVIVELGHGGNISPYMSIVNNGFRGKYFGFDYGIRDGNFPEGFIHLSHDARDISFINSIVISPSAIVTNNFLRILTSRYSSKESGNILNPDKAAEFLDDYHVDMQIHLGPFAENEHCYNICKLSEAGALWLKQFNLIPEYMKQRGWIVVYLDKYGWRNWIFVRENTRIPLSILKWIRKAVAISENGDVSILRRRSFVEGGSACGGSSPVYSKVTKSRSRKVTDGASSPLAKPRRAAAGSPAENSKKWSLSPFIPFILSSITTRLNQLCKDETEKIYKWLRTSSGVPTSTRWDAIFRNLVSLLTRVIFVMPKTRDKVIASKGSRGYLLWSLFARNNSISSGTRTSNISDIFWISLFTWFSETFFLRRKKNLISNSEVKEINPLESPVSTREIILNGASQSGFWVAVSISFANQLIITSVSNSMGFGSLVGIGMCLTYLAIKLATQASYPGSGRFAFRHKAAVFTQEFTRNILSSLWCNNCAQRIYSFFKSSHI
ncbi:MAG: hypothetical protein WAW13_05400, partial [Minisyncoccia bacterium]